MSGKKYFVGLAVLLPSKETRPCLRDMSNGKNEAFGLVKTLTTCFGQFLGKDYRETISYDPPEGTFPEKKFGFGSVSFMRLTDEQVKEFERMMDAQFKEPASEVNDLQII